MNNLKMFCLTLEPTHKEFIKQLGYIPVGLGEKKFRLTTFPAGENYEPSMVVLQHIPVQGMAMP